MIDIRILQMLKDRETYYQIVGRVPEEVFDPKTNALIKDFGKYFEKFPEHMVIDLRTFAPMFSSWHPKLTAEQKTIYATILKQVNKPVPVEERDTVVYQMLELRMAAELARVNLRYDAGEIENLHSATEAIINQFHIDAKVTGIDYVRPDVDALLEAEMNADGLHWRLTCLNDNMRGLRPGDFGIIAARPDRGKTTFFASEITHMAEQTNKPIVWLNNEGPGNRIYPRLWNAALGLTTPELIELHKTGKLIPEYEKAIGGDQHKIRVFDIHGMDTYAVERIIQSQGPSVVVFDMIDNIRPQAEWMGGRTDQQLENMYGWAREMMVKYECAGIASSQISVDGANIQFPADHQLKDSKTGKQGACDFIIMIGSVDDEGYKASRFIGTPKNKLRMSGSSGDPKAVVSYKPETARYVDLEIISGDHEDEVLEAETDRSSATEDSSGGEDTSSGGSATPASQAV